MTKQEEFDREVKVFNKRFKKMFNYENFHKNYPREWNDVFNGETTEVTLVNTGTEKQNEQRK